jgi:hypothetical protein
MTGQHDLDRTLGAWFEAEAEPAPPPEPLARMLESTRHRRPRRALVAGIGSHWVGGRLPIGARDGAPRPAGADVRAVVWALLLLGALVALLLGALLLPGGSPSLPAVVPHQSATPATTAEPSSGPVAEASVGPSATPPVFPSPPESAPGQAVQTKVADLHVARGAPVVVALDDGRVLVVGGLSDAPGEIVDPSARQSTVTEPGAVTGDGSGVLLRDGRVLLVLTDSNHYVSTVFLFDPKTMSWTPVDAPDYQGDELLAKPGTSKVRHYPTLTLLRDGRVLLSGGRLNVVNSGTQTVVDSAALFDPVTETISPTGSMVHPRADHSATTMPDGRVLIAGGHGSCVAEDKPLTGCETPELQSAEIYDPATGTFTATGGMASARGATKGMLLPDGRVLVLPVYIDSVDDGPGLVEIYDPSRRTFASAGTTPHHVLNAALLPDGRAFVNTDTWAGVFDPATRLTQDAPAPPVEGQRPAVLSDGRLMLVGGPWAELYTWP